MKNVALLTLILLPMICYSQWEIQSTAFPDSLRGLEQISVVNENIAWAIAFDGSSGNPIQEFTRTVNGGQTWVPGLVNGVTGMKATAIFALNADTAWSLFYDPVNDGGKVMRTNDGGQSWIHQSTALFPSSLGAYPNLIYFWDENNGLCQGDPNEGSFEIYITNNGGDVWTRVDSNSQPPLVSGEYGYSGYFSVVGDHYWFGTNKGNIYKTTNRGVSWSHVNNPFTGTGKVRVIQFKDTLHGIIGDRTGTTFSLYRTSDGGNTWQPLTPTGTVYGRSIQYLPGTPGTLVSTSNASGAEGSSISYDFGDTWTDIPGSSAVEFTCLSNFVNQTGWAGSENQSSTLDGIAKYKVLSQDAGISQVQQPFCYGDSTVIVTLKNYGYGVLDSTDIKWGFNGIYATFPWTGILGAGEEEEVMVAPYPVPDGNVIFKAFTEDPNGLSDTLATNDTVTSQGYVYLWSGISPRPDTVIGKPYPPSYQFQTDSGYSSYLWSTGDTTYAITIQFQNFGGNVYVWVHATNSNGCFHTDTINPFVIPHYGSIEENRGQKQLLTIIPNPTNGLFTVMLPDDMQHYKIIVYTMCGREVYRQTCSNKEPVMMNGFDEGYYMVKVEAEDKLFYGKLMILR